MNPNCGSVATEILIPVKPFPSGVIICPRITEARLFRLKRLKKRFKKKKLNF